MGEEKKISNKDTSLHISKERFEEIMSKDNDSQVEEIPCRGRKKVYIYSPKD